MNLGRMCEAAARLSDRYDEYVKTAQADGSAQFEGEALHWFKLFRDAVNEAYFEIARSRMTPQTQAEIRLPKDRVIDLNDMNPEAVAVCGVYAGDGESGIDYVFRTKDEIEVCGAQPGERVILRYHYLPERLEEEYDEPVFPESLADPMIYISLAVARVWQSERKMNAAQTWLGEYYQRLRGLRSERKAKARRLKRTVFR